MRPYLLYFIFQLLLAWGIYHLVTHLPEPNALIVSQQQLECSNPLKFNEKNDSEPDAVRRYRDGFFFSKNAWLEARTCSRGQLLIDAVGIPAEGIYPRLRINVNQMEIFNEFITSPRRIELYIPAGDIKVHYDNDYYKADVRIASISNLKFFSSSQCTGFDVFFPQQTGGVWDRSMGTFSLAFKTPMKVVPCGKGVLQFQATGFSAAGEFPILSIKQVPSLNLLKRTEAKVKVIRFNVDKAPIEIYVVNPLNQKVADRNLIIDKIRFSSE